MPGSIKVVGDNVDYAAISDYLETASEKAENLGLKFVVFGSSGSRNIPDGFSRDRAFEQLVKFMKEYVTPVFKKHGLTCAIENLSFGESNVLNLIDESYSLAKAVSSEQVKLLVDFYHFGYNHDSFDSIRKAKDLIAHIHVASVLNDRCFPLLNDSDEAAYKAELDLLREIGYDKREGRVTFEASLPKDKTFAECAVESIKVFKNL
jgi:D-psicose/D-tagatose/L-ribulose 3-epimerase